MQTAVRENNAGTCGQHVQKYSGAAANDITLHTVSDACMDFKHDESGRSYLSIINLIGR